MFEALVKGCARLIATMHSPHPAWLGMDRDMRKLMSLFDRAPSPEQQPPQKLRRSYRLSTSLWSLPTESSVTVRDEKINDNVTLRWYESAGDNEQCLVYFHGGGMMVGDLQTHDRFCRRIARKRRMTVVAVDYRLAPEHPFPAAAEDAIQAWNHVAQSWQGADKDLRNLGIGGDSAGGYLATMVCQQAILSGLTVRSEVMPAWQWLIYPVVDCTERAGESMGTFSHSLILTSPLVCRFHDAYIPERKQQDLLEASPGLASNEVLAQMPPAVVITAEYDPLRDQGLGYARKLRAAGVAVVSHHEAKMPHGYIAFGGFSEGALRGIDKAVSLIDMICLQARRTLPGETVKSKAARSPEAECSVAAVARKS
ncbi:alpha/beta hydrolase [Sansalvadorimonas verongulae]|uniref:alpha/beta hydrolase n=1 Tax=Sansalvadorimonas verongulae TaxID=2172824 RepID=UPI0012BC9B42|nr:alpha/beta hydrolase [Sansalvadorimonas verongulae]MTI12665.1 alpha/beta hydrolase [Sansalvadorimonas verongulae]